MHPSASILVTAGIGGLALAVAALAVLGYARAGARPGVVRFGAGIAAWLVLIAALGATGVLRRYDVRPPPLMVVLVVGSGLAIATATSRIGGRLARGLPLAALIGFHGFRLPLELVMHHAASEGTMPAQMSFAGWNFDILSGASALVVAWLVARGAAPRWLVWAWAVMSSLLLVAIIAIAIASTPMIAAFGASPDRLTTWVGWWPFTWLPCVLVPAAIAGEIVVFRKLRATTTATAAAPPSRASSRA